MPEYTNKLLKDCYDSVKGGKGITQILKAAGIERGGGRFKDVVDAIKKKYPDFQGIVDALKKENEGKRKQIQAERQSKINIETRIDRIPTVEGIDKIIQDLNFLRAKPEDKKDKLSNVE